MIRLRTAAVLAVALTTAVSAFSAAPASGDQLAACDPATAPGLTWSAPSLLAWGRQERVGADVASPGSGPGYVDGSVALSVDAGKAALAPDPVNHDLEFAVTAPAHGAAVNATASWTMVDATGTVRCTQSAALSIPLGVGRTLTFTPKVQKGGITWLAANAGDCHDVALQPISLTVQQGGVTRHLSAPDECNPAGAKRVAAPDWQLTLANGQFQLHAVTAHSSLRAKLRYALRVGPRRVASGGLTLTRIYRPAQLIVVSNPQFQTVCVHGLYPPKWYGSQVGCKIPGLMNVHLAIA